MINPPPKKHNNYKYLGTQHRSTSIDKVNANSHKRGNQHNNTGGFNTPLTPINRSSRQKINKETQALNDTIYQVDLIDIYRTFQLKVEEYTFFSSAHGTFSRRDHILGNKSRLCKFKIIEIVSSIFSDHNTMRLEINYWKKKVKNTNSCRLNNTLLNN